MKEYIIRNAKPEEFERIGLLAIEVYGSLKGFPSKEEEPAYYENLKNMGDLTKDPSIEIFIAVSDQDEIHGVVVYMSNLKMYGKGPSGLPESGASGMRLLAVDPKARGCGLGKKLTNACIQKAKQDGNTKICLHSSRIMPIAWEMYEKMGFKRQVETDFQWTPDIQICGFSLDI